MTEIDVINRCAESYRQNVVNLLATIESLKNAKSKFEERVTHIHGGSSLLVSLDNLIKAYEEMYRKESIYLDETITEARIASYTYD